MVIWHYRLPPGVGAKVTSSPAIVASFRHLPSRPYHLSASSITARTLLPQAKAHRDLSSLDPCLLYHAA
ncbi:hypothetical protein VTH06DRAFT_578 [Thermothelomyces fergusii]